MISQSWFILLYLVYALLTVITPSYSEGTLRPVLMANPNITSPSYGNNSLNYILANTTNVGVQDAPWIILHFTNTNLGNGSYIEISTGGGETQILDGVKLLKWQFYSAFFNGDEVIVKLFVAPNDVNIHYSIDKIYYPDLIPLTSGEPACSYTRTVVENAPVGRIIGLLPGRGTVFGTAFRDQHGNIITAGHVFREYGLGVDDVWSLQFNVPESDYNSGEHNNPEDKNDEYRINTAHAYNRAVWGGPSGPIDEDYCVLRVDEEIDDNDVVGKTLSSRGSYNVYDVPPSPGPVFTLGYGNEEHFVPDRRLNHTLQQASGTLLNPTVSTLLHAQVYVTPGNSGSPVILTSDPTVAVGFMTTDCVYATDGNGTSFQKAALWAQVSKTRIIAHQKLTNPTGIHITSGILTDQEIGKIYRWQPPTGGSGWDFGENAKRTWEFEDPPATMELSADWAVYQAPDQRYYKFHDWDGQALQMAKSFLTSEQTSYFSHFYEIYSDIQMSSIVQSAPELGAGVIEFFDPWLLDGSTVFHGLKINGGMASSHFRSRQGIFTPDRSTEYSNEPGGSPYLYNGVFPNQELSGLAHYQIRAPKTQVISGHTVFFDHWDYDPLKVSLSALESGYDPQNYDEQAVVFKSAGAIIKAVYIDASVYSGWNMVSIPRLVSNYDPNAVYPPPARTSPNVWKYQTGYVVANPLQNGEGYWVKYSQTLLFNYSTATPVSTVDVPVVAGWNVIGSISQPIATSKVRPLMEDITVASKYYRYDPVVPGYVTCTVLEPGRAYWVKMSGPGTLRIELASTSNIPQSTSTELPPAPPPDNSLPAIPSLTSPANGATNQPAGPTFMWVAASGAIYYRLQISTTSSFNPIVQDHQGISSTSKTVSGLAPSQQYYWRVNASNQNGEGGWSAWRSFTTAAFAPPPAPALGGSTYNTHPRLTWNSVGVGVTYRLYRYVCQGTADCGGPTFLEYQGTALSYDDAHIIVGSKTDPERAWYYVVASNSAGSSPNSNKKVYFVGGYGQGSETRIGDITEEGLLPDEYTLSPNYPNPFNPSTKITYALPEPAHVVLTVYNTYGEIVRTLVNEIRAAGFNEVEFDASAIPSGVYFYRIQAGRFTDVKKMILIK